VAGTAQHEAPVLLPEIEKLKKDFFGSHHQKKFSNPEDLISA
jgi:hypothetical protein